LLISILEQGSKTRQLTPFETFKPFNRFALFKPLCGKLGFNSFNGSTKSEPAARSKRSSHSIASLRLASRRSGQAVCSTR
jgi:hypothetical protein